VGESSLPRCNVCLLCIVVVFSCFLCNGNRGLELDEETRHDEESYLVPVLVVSISIHISSYMN